LWFLADRADIDALRQLAVVGMLQTLVATVLGLAFVRGLTFPLSYLLFAVYAYRPLVKPLVHLTAGLSVPALRLTGVPAVLDNLTIITTPFGRWQVTEQCSGIEYLLVYAMASTLFVLLAYRSTVRRIAFVAASLLAAMTANVLRTWGIIFAVYLNGGVDPGHDVIGWIGFAAPLALLLVIGRKFIESPLRQESPADAALAPSMPGTEPRRLLAALTAIAVVATAPAAASALERASTAAASSIGCHPVERVVDARDGTPITRIRTQCSGPAGRKQAPAIAWQTLAAIAPRTLTVEGKATVVEPGRTDIRATTLSTVGNNIPYRLTYWYELGDRASGSWFDIKMRLALALLHRRDATVTVVTELQQLPDSP
jgi:exosortase